MGKSDMKMFGLKLLFTSPSSNILTMLFTVKDGGIIIKKVMRLKKGFCFYYRYQLFKIIRQTKALLMFQFMSNFCKFYFNR